MDTDEYFYILEVEASNFKIRICSGEDYDSDCDDIEVISHSQSVATENGAMFAVAGEDASTEFAIFFVENTETNGKDECDTGDWATTDWNGDEAEDAGYAMYCVSGEVDGVISESGLTDWCDCGGETTCLEWDAAPDADTFDYPAAGQFSVGFGSTSANPGYANRVCAGELE
jgi:hypothetical protein